MNENEIWKDVLGYEGLYQVSNLGQIRSTLRKGSKGLVMKPFLDTQGYCRIDLCKNCKRTSHRVHRLVAIAFIENDNENYTQIDHINRIRTDNKVSNLRWVDTFLNAQNRKPRIKRSSS